MAHQKTIGSRAEVMHGTAKKTSGGLRMGDLKYNKHGRIVSRRKSEAGKRSLKHLLNAGYKAVKGKFSLGKKMLAGKTAKAGKKRRARTQRRRYRK
jgi:hypothetical protein